MSSDSEITSVEQSDSEETDPREEIEMFLEMFLVLFNLAPIELSQTDQMETDAYVFQA